MNIDPKTREPTLTTHYATCPQAAQWRKRGARSGAPPPRQEAP